MCYGRQESEEQREEKEEAGGQADSEKGKSWYCFFRNSILSIKFTNQKWKLTSRLPFLVARHIQGTRSFAEMDRVSSNSSASAVANFLLENSLDGQTWLQMRITHLREQAEQYEIGVYACSPIGTDFRCVFKTLEIADNQWLGLPEAGE